MTNTKNRGIKYVLLIFISFILLGACAQEEDSNAQEEQSEMTTNQQTQESGDMPTPKQQESGSAQNTQQTMIPSIGPWNSSIILATSKDGMKFTKWKTLVEHAAVPSLLLTADGNVIATYQYFVEDGEVTTEGSIAYSLSEDQGKTWTKPALVKIEGLPEPISGPPEQGSFFVTRAVDPTMVELSDGSFRIYFTYQEEGTEAYLASALNTAGDMSEVFTYEEGSGVSTDGPIIDPSVIYFDGIWQHLTWDITQDETTGNNGPPVKHVDRKNYHSISTDGIIFTLQDRIILDMDFLGQVIEDDGGLRFYGTAYNGIVSAFSADGYTWEMDEGTRMEHSADPGMTKLTDGSYLMLYIGRTSP